MKRVDIKKYPLSDTTLASLEPEEKEYRVKDSNNLYFTVHSKGNKRWELRYKRPSDGKWTWLGLGGYPSVGGKLARKNAEEMRKLISEGIDPKIDRQNKKQAELLSKSYTFEQLAIEFCLTKTWTEGTRVRNEGALKNHIYPVMGKLDYRKITKKAWLELFKAIQKKLHPKTKEPIVEMGKRLCTLCREIYDFAEVTGRIDYNPVAGITKFLDKHEKQNMPHVSEKELPELLKKIKAYPNRMTAIGLELSVMLGTRPSEMRQAVWEEFDFQENLWSIPAHRMKKRKEHIIPLPQQALSLLNELKIITSDSVFLFPSRSTKKKPISNNTFNKALKSLGYQGRQTPHGFRHILSTTLREKGFRKEYVETALAHTVGGVEGVYNKAQYLKQRAVMMQKWANYLDDLVNNSASAFGFENTDIFDSLENMGLSEDQKNIISKVIEQLLMDSL
ncbi:tyrosine-type recombinase/integrase [Acinetobacter baumannii]|uniref:tyrosine-type recombinase/integrase n=1 Tax=Acinetobacter baumannii TaxID=470 RepID=UPI0024481E84|nr:tyrosine-type recombinase/integrase [Acinetobacter baumannii]MDH2494872.1 tyrosine-type recombinase/integrase [Acinetobacter baumannii]